MIIYEGKAVLDCAKDIREMCFFVVDHESRLDMDRMVRQSYYVLKHIKDDPYKHRSADNRADALQSQTAAKAIAAMLFKEIFLPDPTIGHVFYDDLPPRNFVLGFGPSSV